MRTSSSLSLRLLAGVGGLLFGCQLLKTGDQDAEVKRMYVESHLVLCLLQVIARSRYFGGRDPVGCMNSYQLCQWLGNHGSTGEECQLSLRDDETLRRYRGSRHSPKCSRGNLDNLQIGDVQRIGLVGDRREIGGTFASLFVLVLGHLEARDLERPILADREMDGLGQREATDVGGIQGRRSDDSNRNHRGRAKEILAIHCILLMSLKLSLAGRRNNISNR